MSVSRRRLAQSHGDQLRFRLAIQFARRGRFSTFLAVESQLKAFGDESFTEALDRLHTTIECLGDLGVSPARPVGIRLEQNLGTTKLLR